MNTNELAVSSTTNDDDRNSISPTHSFTTDNILPKVAHFLSGYDEQMEALFFAFVKNTSNDNKRCSLNQTVRPPQSQQSTSGSVKRKGIFEDMEVDMSRAQPFKNLKINVEQFEVMRRKVA